MSPTRCIAHAALIGIASFLPFVTLPMPGDAQQCELKVRPVGGELGYGPKDARRCEGMYVELQSAPVVLRVVSLTRGRVPVGGPGPDSLIIHVPTIDTLELVGRITILAQPIAAGVNWALDAWATADEPLHWDKAELFDSTRIALGFAGRTTRSTGARDPVYVPVEVAFDAPAPPGAVIPDSIHIVFHVPGAGEARLCVASLTCVSAERLRTGGYFDGFFGATVATSALPAGILQLVVQWRGGPGDDIHRDRFDALLKS